MGDKKTRNTATGNVRSYLKGRLVGAANHSFRTFNAKIYNVHCNKCFMC